MPSLGLIGQAAGTQVNVAGKARFYVNGFTLMGVELAGGGPAGEVDLLVEMVGTTIDPAVLQVAATVDDALSAIAINAGNAVCAQLEACRKRASQSAWREPLPAETPPQAEVVEPEGTASPPPLEALPTALLASPLP